MDEARALLRHTLATLACRADKTLPGAPPEFATHRAGPGARAPAEILAHMGDLLDWAPHLARGCHVWQDSPPRPWDAEATRFHAAPHAGDDDLASDAPLDFPADRLLQGPVADAL